MLGGGGSVVRAPHVAAQQTIRRNTIVVYIAKQNARTVDTRENTFIG